MPSGCDLIQGMEPGRDTTDRTVVLGGFLHAGERFLNHGVNLRHVTFLAALRDLEDPRFRFLHQFLYVLRLVKTFLLDLGGHRNQVTCCRFLGNHLRMVTQVCRRSHASGQIGYIDCSAGFLQRTHTTQFLAYRQHINRLVLACQLTDGFIHQTVLVFVENLRTQQVCDSAVRIFLNHDGAEHGIFQLLCLRGQFAHLVSAHFDDGGLRRAFIFTSYCHMQLINYAQR